MSVSVILPVYNAEKWIGETLDSIASQSIDKSLLEVSIYNDCSSDESMKIINNRKLALENLGVTVIIGENDGTKGRGCGWAKNQAIKQSSGKYLCFLDADDIMMEQKIEIQLNKVLEFNEPVLLGSNFKRIPKEATKRFSEWHESINEEDLLIKRFREVTIIHPTWFMSREVWEIVGGYDESYPGCPEDMIFFYKWIEHGGKVCKIKESLTLYRWHENATSYSIHRNTLLKVKIEHFEKTVLSKNEIDEFTIWGVGRDGKKFFMTLSDEYKNKVVAFCDINPKKIGTEYMDHKTRRKIPIIHFSKAKPLVVVCVALNRSLGNGPIGEFEKNLISMNWIEGKDYWQMV